MARSALIVNPKKRTTARKTRRKTPAKKLTQAKVGRHRHRVTGKAAASRAGRALRRRQRNPIKKGIVNEQLVPAAIAGAGAVGLNMLFDRVPLPANWKVGNLRFAAEAATAVGAGMLLEQTKLIKNKRMRDDIISGALTVVAYKAITANLPATMGGATTSLSGYRFAPNAPRTGINGYTSLGYMQSGMNAGTNVRPIRSKRSTL